MRDVRFLAGEEIIQADNVMPARDQAIAQMRTEKSGAAGHQDSFE